MFPDHELPDHVFPDHELPDQVFPLHVPDDHEFPDQEFPDHVFPDQEFPDQELPLHLDPFQTPPDQEFPAASAAASTEVSMATPKMSCSPASATPSRVMWSLPRDASSEPVPVDGAHVWVQLGSEAVRAAPSCSSPAPIACDFPLIGVAVLISSFLT